MLYAIIILQIIVLVYSQYAHTKERKDLYNRIMSRDLGDYQRLSGNPPSKGGNFIKAQMLKNDQSRREA